MVLYTFPLDMDSLDFNVKIIVRILYMFDAGDT